MNRETSFHLWYILKRPGLLFWKDEKVQPGRRQPKRENTSTTVGNIRRSNALYCVIGYAIH